MERDAGAEMGRANGSEPATENGAVRLGLAYVNGLRREDAEAVVAAREAGGPFASVGDFAARSGLGRAGLSSLAWAGSVDALAGDRRAALWQLGVAAPGERMDGGTQLALPLDVPAAPALNALSEWESLLADYGTTGVTLGAHALELLRRRCRRRRSPAPTSTCSRTGGTSRSAGS